MFLQIKLFVILMFSCQNKKSLANFLHITDIYSFSGGIRCLVLQNIHWTFCTILLNSALICKILRTKNWNIKERKSMFSTSGNFKVNQCASSL